MFKFFQKKSGILKNFLLKQYRNYKHEDFGYLAAFLARSREKLSEKISENHKILSDGIKI